MNQNKYQTNNFYLAAFLLCRGQKLIDLNKTNPNKADFIFDDSPDREKLVRAFLFNQEVLVDIKKFIFFQKELKNKLYN